MSVPERYPLAKLAADSLRERERQRIFEATLTAAAAQGSRTRAALRAWWDDPASRREPVRRAIKAAARRELGRRPSAAELRAFAFDLFDAYTLARAWLLVDGVPAERVEASLLRGCLALVWDGQAEAAAIDARLDELIPRRPARR